MWAESRAVRADLGGESAATTLSLDLPDGAVVAVVPDVAGGSDLAYELNGWRDDLVVAHDPGALHLDRDEPRVLLVEAGRRRSRPVPRPARHGRRDRRGPRRGVPVWLVVDVGRRLPGPLFDVVVPRASAAVPGRSSRSRSSPIAEAERVIEPRRIDCPVPPELLRAPSGW